MAWYYICGNATEQEAQAALDAVNSADWFPVVGKVKGTPAPANCQTTCWCTELLETLDGRFVFPCIPMTRLTALGVPQEEIQQWIADHSVTWEEIPAEDFPQPKDEE